MATCVTSGRLTTIACDDTADRCHVCLMELGSESPLSGITADACLEMSRSFASLDCKYSLKTTAGIDLSLFMIVC